MRRSTVEMGTPSGMNSSEASDAARGDGKLATLPGRGRHSVTALGQPGEEKVGSSPPKARSFPVGPHARLWDPRR
jgi:hypothetical protein